MSVEASADRGARTLARRARATGWVPAMVVALVGCSPTPDTGTTPIRRPQVAAVEVPGPASPPGVGACASNEFLKSEVPKVTTEVVKSAQTHRFLDPLPARISRGLEALSVKGSKLTVFTSAKGRFDEFEGVISETVESSQYEARPGVALIAHTITLGIGLFVAPVKSAQHAFGCVDRRVTGREVRAEDSLPTGAFQWRGVPTQFLLRIEGVGPVRDLSVSHVPQGAAAHVVDLLDTILEHRIDGPVQIKVSCLNCEAAQAEVGSAISSRSEWSIEADFTRVRAAEVERRDRLAEAARVAQQARDREARILELARSALVGRWESRDACVNAEREDFGMFFEALPSGHLRSRRLMVEGGRLVTKTIADPVRLRVLDAGSRVLEVELPHAAPGGRRLAPQRVGFTIDGGQMRILTLFEGTSEQVRSGLRVSDGRPVDPLYNCSHPSMREARAEAVRAREAERKRAEALKQQKEREEAERRRVEEAARLEREREAAELRRIQEERRRRQEI